MKPNSQPAPAQPVRPRAAADRRPEQPAFSAPAAISSPKVAGQATDGDYPTLPPARHYRGARRRWASQPATE